MPRRPIRPRIQSSPDRADAPGARALRDAFAAWTSGVTVIAVRTATGMRGVTASAFTPVSVEPPLVLVCLSQHAPMLACIREHGRFTVNVLAADQKRTAGLYADRFTALHAKFSGEADAILAGALASFVCTLESEHDGGDHRVLIGQVRRFDVDDHAAPLLYTRGAYRTLD